MLTDNNTDTEKTLSEGSKCRKNFFQQIFKQYGHLKEMLYYRILKAKKWNMRLPNNKSLNCENNCLCLSGLVFLMFSVMLNSVSTVGKLMFPMA